MERRRRKRRCSPCQQVLRGGGSSLPAWSGCAACGRQVPRLCRPVVGKAACNTLKIPQLHLGMPFSRAGPALAWRQSGTMRTCRDRPLAAPALLAVPAHCCLQHGRVERASVHAARTLTAPSSCASFPSSSTGLPCPAQPLPAAAQRTKATAFSRARPALTLKSSSGAHPARLKLRAAAGTARPQQPRPGRPCG